MTDKKNTEKRKRRKDARKGGVCDFFRPLLSVVTTYIGFQAATVGNKSAQSCGRGPWRAECFPRRWKSSRITYLGCVCILRFALKTVSSAESFPLPIESRSDSSVLMRHALRLERFSKWIRDRSIRQRINNWCQSHQKFWGTLMGIAFERRKSSNVERGRAKNEEFPFFLESIFNFGIKFDDVYVSLWRDVDRRKFSNGTICFWELKGKLMWVLWFY